uniref:Uncharacterized protein n=1 Tax=Hyaloperonospora arabidopsidis (strain Emoy2) TaxID=559515 RepID=M4C5U4_HYAAE
MDDPGWSAIEDRHWVRQEDRYWVRQGSAISRCDRAEIKSGMFLCLHPRPGYHKGTSICIKRISRIRRNVIAHRRETEKWECGMSVRVTRLAQSDQRRMSTNDAGGGCGKASARNFPVELNLLRTDCMLQLSRNFYGWRTQV